MVVEKVRREKPLDFGGRKSHHCPPVCAGFLLGGPAIEYQLFTSTTVPDLFRCSKLSSESGGLNGRGLPAVAEVVSTSSPSDCCCNQERAVSSAPKSVFRTKPRLATGGRNGDRNKLGQFVSSGRNLVLLFDGTGLSIRLFLALV